MELFIRIKDGQPFEHPIFEDNFRQAFPNVDVNNLPIDFARFERVQPPTLGVYERNQHAIYERGDDGIYRDVWYADQMDESEKLAKQNAVKADWNLNGYPSWIFNETTCLFDPPTPKPTDGKMYEWDEATTSWKESV